VPETVTIVVLANVVGFAWAVNVIVALLEPIGLLTVNHFWSEVVVQLMLEEISIVFVLLAEAEIVNVIGETVKTGAAPVCDIAIIWEGTPVPETVTVAVLSFVVGFAIAVNVMVELFEPVGLFNVNQLWLLVGVQLILELTAIVAVLPPDAAIVREIGETVKTGAAPVCVTSID
jgi:hypothetical protein